MKVKTDYIYIFLHIPRTAGTTFVKQIEANYDKNEILRLYYKELNLSHDRNYSQEDYLDLIQKKVDKRKKDKIKVIYGHRVPYGVHGFFNKEPFYITFLRDPISRSVSAYNLWSNSYRESGKKEKQSKLFENGFLVDGKVPSFEEWLEAKIKDDNMATLGATLARFLSRLGYLQKKENEHDVGGFVDKFGYIGLIESYLKDYLVLDEILGLEKLVGSENISKREYVDSRDYSESKVKKLLKKDYDFYHTTLPAVKEKQRKPSVGSWLQYLGKVLKMGNNPKLVVREFLVMQRSL